MQTYITYSDADIHQIHTVMQTYIRAIVAHRDADIHQRDTVMHTYIR